MPPEETAFEPGGNEYRNAVAWADAQIAAARDDPAARLALMDRLFHGPTGLRVGTALTTPASWPATWNTKEAPQKRTRRSASS
jgi:hypothetical protein